MGPFMLLQGLFAIVQLVAILESALEKHFIGDKDAVFQFV